MEILLVEDDPVLGRGLVVGLELEQYKVEWMQDLRSAFDAYKKKVPELILLDWNLPDGSGLSFLSEIRKSNKKIPVILLTARTDEDSVVAGLNAGANDYIRKPFGQKELLARIKTAVKNPVKNEAELRYQEVVLFRDKRKAFFNEKELELNRREFDILSYFVQHSESVVTREALLSALKSEGEIYDRTVDSHVSHVRSRLRNAGVESMQISSIYGVGYRLEKK